MTYWGNIVESTGGKTDTKNRKEQEKLELSEWVMEGINNGAMHYFKDRINGTDFKVMTKCEDDKGKVSWGTACE